MLLLLLSHLDRAKVDPQITFLESGPFADETAALGVPTSVVSAGRLRNVGRGASAVARLSSLSARET